MSNRPLGRRPPTDWAHADKHPFAAAPAPTKPTPVVIGSLWPEEADQPVWDQKTKVWRIKGPFSGRSRGGHGYCLEAHNMRDSDANWHWWDQVSEGICVSEGITRAAALLWRRRYQPRPLYDAAQAIDEYDDTPPEEGTSVRAGFDVWRTRGLVPAKLREDHWERAEEVDGSRSPGYETRLQRNVWATSAQQVLDALGTPARDWVTVLNSWGTSYPHRTRLSADDLQWLLERDGEAGIPMVWADV